MQPLSPEEDPVAWMERGWREGVPVAVPYSAGLASAIWEFDKPEMQLLATSPCAYVRCLTFLELSRRMHEAVS